MNKFKFFITLILVSFAFHPNFAVSKVVNSVGLGIGVCLPQGGWDPGYTIIAQADFGEAIKYVYISPYLSYSNAIKSEEINQNAEEMSIQYLGIGAKLVGYLNSKPKGFYLGGAISYNIISYDTIKWTEIPENTYILNESTNRIGFTGLAGYLFLLKKISIFVEIDYMLTTGGLNNLTATTGVNINL